LSPKDSLFKPSNKAVFHRFIGLPEKKTGDKVISALFSQAIRQPAKKNA